MSRIFTSVLTQQIILTKETFSYASIALSNHITKKAFPAKLCCEELGMISSYAY
jgi:hypothetical protein